MAWLKSIILEIYDLDERVAMLALKRGLHSSRFTYSLDKIYQKSYSKLLTRAQKYIWAEEATVVRWEIDRKPRRKKPREDHSNNPAKKPITSHQQSPKSSQNILITLLSSVLKWTSSWKSKEKSSSTGHYPWNLLLLIEIKIDIVNSIENTFMILRTVTPWKMT